jgi:hypothetical protein
MRWSNWLVHGIERLETLIAKVFPHQPAREQKNGCAEASSVKAGPVGTFIRKQDAAWLRDQLSGKMDFEIHCWRSVSVRFLRAVVHTVTGGRILLRLIYWLEDRFPRFMGEKGQYPLIVIRKISA